MFYQIDTLFVRNCTTVLRRRVARNSQLGSFVGGVVEHIGVARIFDWGGAQILKNSVVFTEIESDFSAEIGNSNDFSAQNQVISKKKKKRSSPKLREVFRPKPLALLLLYCLITVMCAITEKKTATKHRQAMLS